MKLFILNDIFQL